MLADHGDAGQQGLHPLVPVVVRRGHSRAVKIIGKSADPRADRHLVVVEDDQQLGLQTAGIVECLEDDARGQRAVADDGHGMSMRPAHDLVADLQPQSRGQGAAGVPGHEQVVGALGRVGVAHQAAPGPDRVQFGGTAGDQLVRIDLVARVPHQAVLREIEGQVQGQAELDDTEIAGEVSRPATDHAEQLGSHLGGELIELFLRQLLEIGRRPDPCQQRVRIHHQRSLSKRASASSRRRWPREPSGASAATASSASCWARRRLPSMPRNRG